VEAIYLGAHLMSRRRWVYTDGGRPLSEPIEVSEDYVGEVRDGHRRSEEEIYGKITATDGTDLSTRKRHRDYMKANGLALADDYKNTWAKAEQRRQEYARGNTGQGKQIREAVARALYERKRR